MNFKDYITIRENFPKEGISFKDITPLLQDKEAFKAAIDEMTKPFKNLGVTKVLCADARGFLFGSAMAYLLNAGLSIGRKPNKLPFVADSQDYGLEYGKNTFQIPPHAVDKGDKVLIVDDLLATGGSAQALSKMVLRAGGEVVGYSFAIELTGLKGRDKLENSKIFSLIDYEF